MVTRLKENDFFVFLKFEHLESDEKPVRNCHYNQSFGRNHSDGSENSDEYDEDYEEEQANLSLLVDPNEDLLVPRVLVRNRPVRFDRVSPKLINQMNEQEKENYIELCQKLYMEIYDV